MTFVSILTPTWNRAAYLGRVHDSLRAQTSSNLEWVVVDDGSSDGTRKLMKDLMASSPLPVTYARFAERVGKCRADNLLLDLASGDFVVWCDSDDALTPNAVETFLAAWDTINAEESEQFLGVVALCADSRGKIQSTGAGRSEPFVCQWGELATKYGMTGDMCIMQRRRAIGEKRFPEHDLVMNESGFWHQFMHMRMICIPDILKMMTRDTENRISGSRLMEYCRGKAHSIAYADSGKFNALSLSRQLRLASTYHRYAIHGDLSLAERSRLFAARKTPAYFAGVLPGALLALKDTLQRRVAKSHELFEKGKSARPIVARNVLAENISAGAALFQKVPERRPPRTLRPESKQS
jgi:glycosyltransferase involved in cell wall biosynthesis